MKQPSLPPFIGITADADAERFFSRKPYACAVAAVGGVPVVLPHVPECVDEYVQRCDGFVFSGGDDPIMEQWGVKTHPKATRSDPDRQAFEVALLEALDNQRDKPVLGVCLGMQLMGLHAGGTLEQYLPDSLATADQHWGRADHPIAGELGAGEVFSHHRQALSDAGSLRVIATAPDGVIEAVRADDRPFYLGVQWHLERTGNHSLGRGLLQRFISASGGHERR